MESVPSWLIAPLAAAVLVLVLLPTRSKTTGVYVATLALEAALVAVSIVRVAIDPAPFYWLLLAFWSVACLATARSLLKSTKPVRP